MSLFWSLIYEAFTARVAIRQPLLPTHENSASPQGEPSVQVAASGTCSLFTDSQKGRRVAVATVTTLRARTVDENGEGVEKLMIESPACI